MDFSQVNLADHQPLARKILEEALKKGVFSRREFQTFRNKIIKREQGKIFHNLYFVKAYEDLIREGKIKPNEEFLSLIQKRRVRTMSGVAPVTVITKPWPCPGKCTYCPTDVRMPKSYLPSQPAAQRGFRQRFDPYSQVYVRLKALEMEGHEISKVELRILGGTWSSYPKSYQTWFVKRCLQAMNEYPNSKSQTAKISVVKVKVVSRYGTDLVNKVVITKPFQKSMTLQKAIFDNETAEVRCIGINIETRPDFIDTAEIKRLRRLGVTKVEMGVQTTDDRVQELTRRGHDLACVRKATALLKDAGFKIGYHMMPNLPGSTVEQDKRMIGELFVDPSYQPDYLKIYPCVVIPGTALAVQYRRQMARSAVRSEVRLSSAKPNGAKDSELETPQLRAGFTSEESDSPLEGDYKPYDDATLEEILLENLRSVPEWCRIDRVARDIPSDKIEAGTRISNIRQLLEEQLRREGRPCRDIRSREIGGFPFNREEVKLVRREYGNKKFEILNPKSETNSKFQIPNPKQVAEIFLSFEDQRQDKLIALLRLRFPYETFFPELQGAAIVREVHVYGKQIAVGEKGKDKQHGGWGARLMKEAENLAKKAGYKKLAVIAGIGTRQYYRKLGYFLQGTYMVKNI